MKVSWRGFCPPPCRGRWEGGAATSPVNPPPLKDTTGGRQLRQSFAEAAGKSVGLEPIKPNQEKISSDEPKVVKQQPKVTDLYRSVSQDDMMGYDDDDY